MSQEPEPEQSVSQQSGPEQKGAPKGLLRQMEELMAALNTDLTQLDTDPRSPEDRTTTDSDPRQPVPPVESAQSGEVQQAYGRGESQQASEGDVRE
ncbi:hypothetical protein [Streptomyces sp. NPDC051994]|uniref:hypothetical protein n=1 Tax=unclassified Streptomyces TaxID=2593676 RepID=UPI003423AC3F